MGLLELCKKYFNTSNLYEVLQISDKSSENEVKKAYRKLSLKVHPDRVKDEEKLEATEKFKVLGNIHAILSDKEKREQYDETKSVDEEDYNDLNAEDWTVYWKNMFKRVTEEDIKAYEKEYIGSEEEKNDLKTAYVAGQGDMDYIVDQVQFARSEHEPRLREILTEMIEQGDIPSYEIFTHESARKRQRRHAKERREAKEAEELKDTLGLNTGGSLELTIRQRQQSRAQQMNSVIDSISAKYAGKPKASKRKAGNKSETGIKNKRKK